MRLRPTYSLLGIVLLLWPSWAVAGAQGWKLLFSLPLDSKGEVLARPFGLLVDGQTERYYVTDTGHDRLLSFSKDGQFLHAFTAGGALQKPIAMVKRGEGRLLVVEKGKSALTEIDLKSKEVLPHTIEDRGRKVAPQRLRAGEQGLYLLDRASGAILRLDQGLKVSGRLACPGDCRAGYADFTVKGGRVYAIPQLGREVHVFEAQGASPQRIPLQPAPEFPVSLAVGEDGGFLVLERHAGTVARYLADGRLLGRCLGPGHKAEGLSYPVEIQLDPWGRVCVVDEGNGRVSVFQP